MVYKVLIPQDVAEEGKAFLREHGYKIKMGSGWNVSAIKRDVADCDAILARTAPYTNEVLEAAPRLKVIARAGAGYNNIDVGAAERLGIWVAIAAQANYNSVAELAIGFIVALGRDMVTSQYEFRRGNFGVRNPFCGMDVEGKTLGIAGLGKIGRSLAEKARLGLGMRILAYDPYVTQAQAPEGVEMVDGWEAIFARPDYVSLHMPSSGKPLVGAREFGWMKPSAYFINLARGDIVAEDALIAALREKKIAGAALDVFVDEPPARDNPLLAMENVITVPHIGGLTKEAMARMSLHAAQEVDRVLTGGKPNWPVNQPPSPR